MKNEYLEEVITLFPSKELQGVLLQTIPEWNVMKTATLAFRYMGRHRFSNFLIKLVQETDISLEKGLLHSASHDVRQHSFRRLGFSERTEKLHEQLCKKKGKNPAVGLFLECCRLPILVNEGDIILFRNNRKLAYGIVAHVPQYSDRNFDLSDEVICVYDLSVKPDSENWDYNDIFLLPSDMDKVPEKFVPINYKKNLPVYRKLLGINTEESNG